MTEGIRQEIDRLEVHLAGLQSRLTQLIEEVTILTRERAELEEKIAELEWQLH